jgi:hypothetical protein
MAKRIDAAWTDLRRRLEQRCRALHEAVRAYPTPIARCDDQLPKAIEERDSAFRELRAADALDEARRRLSAAEWRERLREFAAAPRGYDDPALCAARERVIAALWF